jgi:hypothetical protein
MKNQKGFLDLTLILALVIIIAVGGFVWWRVSNADEPTVADSTLKTTKTANTEELEPTIPEGWVEYVNEEFGFSFAYPAYWGQLKENRTNYEDIEGTYATGKIIGLVQSDSSGEQGVDDILITSASDNYSVPKGPAPLSYTVASGYFEEGGEYYYNSANPGAGEPSLSETNSAVFLPKIKAIYFEDTPEFEPGVKYYTYAFDTTIGGLSIYTTNSSQLDLLESIANTVTVK